MVPSHLITDEPKKHDIRVSGLVGFSNDLVNS